MLNLKTIAVAATLAIGSIGAFAQTPTATPRVDQREAVQQNRIADGVAKGELTPRQTRHLEKQQRHIRHAEAKAKSDGVVTGAERAKLTAMQDHAGANIAVDKKVGAAVNR
jgi:hypothetical protein